MALTEKGCSRDGLSLWFSLQLWSPSKDHGEGLGQEQDKLNVSPFRAQPGGARQGHWGRWFAILPLP